MPSTTLINALGTQIIRADRTPIVELVASPETNTVQQSVVRILCDVSAERLEIKLPTIQSYNGNWGIVTILFSDIQGFANVNPITIFANTGDTIEGRGEFEFFRSSESITFRVGSFIEGRGTWDRA